MSLRRLGVLPLVGLSWWVVAAGCSEKAPAASDVGSTSLVATGAGGASPCNGHFPDGFCAAYATVPESCACADCTETALCGKKCSDNGKCDFEAGEDCSCKDCFFLVAKCGPSNGGCQNNDDGACGTTENCTCPDCTNTEYCKSHCDNNGECVQFFEGCSCADCKMLPACGGTASAAVSSSSVGSTTSGAGGGGGAGGA